MIYDAKKCWAVIPAAGVGKRMAGNRPKQYLSLDGQTILAHTLARFRHHPRINGVVVVISKQDRYWPRLAIDTALSPLWVAKGGAERVHSVLNGLSALQNHAQEDDWVLVHDAARPCLRSSDINQLIDAVTSNVSMNDGGLLAVPMADTVKRAGVDGQVDATVDRCQLWRALTPQMFRLGLLQKALSHAISHDILVTDEASAMERAGYRPLLVEGHGDNIKITHPQDLPMAQCILYGQGAD